MNQKIKIYAPLAISLIILCFSIVTWDRDLTQHKKKNCPDKKYTLLDPLVVCDSFFNEKIQRVKDLEFEVAKLINGKIEKKEIMGASVFYRDLNSRRWFGINPDEDFYPASLLKLPEAIAYFKYAEGYPDILSRKVKIPEDQEDKNSGQYFKFGGIIEPGQEYSIETLIKDLIEYSDNTPIQILNQNLPSDFSYNVFRDLGLPEPIIYNGKSSWSITVRIYGNILRTLYLSSYLSPKSSEQILTYLSNTKFAEGLKAVAPKDTRIANKFGEARLLNQDGTTALQVLHDCGIVYAPKHPYTICIMTQGMEIPPMIEAIQDIADMVYKRHNLMNPEKQKETHLELDD